MDMFYAAVEIRDRPELAERPIAVGSLQMISTANYVARKFGIRSAMPGFIALELCPDLQLIPCNMHKYKAVSQIMRKIVAEYDPNYASMGLDEVNMDVTDFL
jgi:DNA polymerase kappa